LRAIGWIVDERGLGGGRTSDGLSWSLPLEQLWERQVESVVRHEAANTGGQVRTGRLRETIIPLPWDHASHRSLGHLVPDFVIQRAETLEIVDAKYKAHFADLDYTRWTTFAEGAKESLRADIHQVLAYAALFPPVETVLATLMYPVNQELYADLRVSYRDVVTATIPVGSRSMKLSLRALPFGGPHTKCNAGATWIQEQ
jgi:5-methylcytosine-specific restriction endonuclease McrBC regulatory subunit McrC